MINVDSFLYGPCAIHLGFFFLVQIVEHTLHTSNWISLAKAREKKNVYDMQLIVTWCMECLKIIWRKCKINIYFGSSTVEPQIDCVFRQCFPIEINRFKILRKKNRNEAAKDIKINWIFHSLIILFLISSIHIHATHMY